MRCLRWFCVLLVASAPAVAFAGDIQVTCEPGVRVFLDGKFAGFSNVKDDGFFLADVPEGAHVILVDKHGFASQTFDVKVGKLPIQVKVAAFTSEASAGQESEHGNAKVEQPLGDLQVMSAPQDCVVTVDGKARPKNTPVLLIAGLTEGEHPISFSKQGYEPVSGTVTIQAGTEVTVRGDLKAGKVENVYEGEGSLRVLSTPEYCMVRFLGKTMDKNGMRLNVTHVPAGEHRIVVLWNRYQLSSTIKILNGQRTVVVVSFLKKDKPFVVSYEPE
jgi:hypothetical protein